MNARTPEVLKLQLASLIVSRHASLGRAQSCMFQEPVSLCFYASQLVQYDTQLRSKRKVHIYV